LLLSGLRLRFTLIDYMKKFSENKLSAVDTLQYEKIFAATVPNNDIRRVVKRILMDYEMDSLPTVVLTLGDLTKVVPSSLTIIQCMLLLKKYSETNVTHRHPMYLPEIIIERNDIKVYNDRLIELSDTPLTMVAKMGMIVQDPFQLYIGATATLINYYTREDDKQSISASFF